MNNPIDPKRRQLILSSLLIPFAPVSLAIVQTPKASEGPFYPTERMRFDDVDNDLVIIAGKVKEAGGEIVRISGKVKDRAGRSISNARVEIWQCDVNGRYLHTRDFGQTERDQGFQGFGQSITNGNGMFEFRTIKPVPYAGRTPHIHLKVWHQNQELLTSQLYLADHPQNQSDFLFQRIPPTQRGAVSLVFDNSDEPSASVDLIV